MTALSPLGFLGSGIRDSSSGVALRASPPFLLGGPNRVRPWECGREATYQWYGGEAAAFALRANDQRKKNSDSVVIPRRQLRRRTPKRLRRHRQRSARSSARHTVGARPRAAPCGMAVLAMRRMVSRENACQEPFPPYRWGEWFRNHSLPGTISSLPAGRGGGELPFPFINPRRAHFLLDTGSKMW